MHLLKVVGLYGLIICILGPLLLLTEVYFYNSQAQQQIGPIFLVGIFFFIFTTIEIFFGAWLHKQRNKIITSYYLLMKIVRILVLSIIIVVYALMGGSNLQLFAMNVFAFYLVTLFFISAYFMVVENHKKKTENE